MFAATTRNESFGRFDDPSGNTTTTDRRGKGSGVEFRIVAADIAIIIIMGVVLVGTVIVGIVMRWLVVGSGRIPQ